MLADVGHPRLVEMEGLSLPDPEPLVSVVIPCYRQAHFLGKAIESVRAQTYSNVEVIVVDDGSPDDVAAVVRRYPEVRLIRQENRGLSAARNAGFRASGGAYVLFLDADDWLRPSAVEVGVRILTRAPDASFAAGGHQVTEPDGETLGQTFAPRQGERPYADLLRGNHIGMHAAVLYRREALEAIGGFDEALPACEDYDLYLRLSARFPVAFHDQVVAVYRRHGENMSDDPGFMLRAALYVLNKQRDHMSFDTELKGAYTEGVRFWKRYYASVRLGQSLGALKEGHLSTGLRGLVRPAKWAPLWFASQMARRASRIGARKGRATLAALMPTWLRRSLARWRQGSYAPPPGRVDFGDLRRLSPISTSFGFDRGLPVDRYYVERFLEARADDIRGRTLEIGDATYSHRFGGARVERADVLHVVEGNPEATFVDDLTDGRTLPSDAFDCIVLTQTLHVIYDVRAAIATLYRILKPGGVLLATFPGLSQIVYDDWGKEWHWGFTAQSAGLLLGEAFPAEQVVVEAHGNVLAATAFLQGLAAEELTEAELTHNDSAYQLLLTARAVKPYAG